MPPDTTDPVRTGAHRSLEILHELSHVRIKALGRHRSSRTVGDLDWHNVQAGAIQRDDTRSVWHAGHVTALLSNDVDVVAATQTGGVWLLKSIVGPTPLAGFTSTPLSDEWDAPNVSCLAWGPSAAHIFAGSSGGGAIVLEFDNVLGGLFHKQTVVIPGPFSQVTAVVTLRNPNRIVVVADRHVWSSPIPDPPESVEGYDWQGAEGLSPSATLTGLAAGPSATVAVATVGGKIGVGLPPAPAAIHRGTFESGALVFTESSISGLDPARMGTTSLASCEDHPERMYAVSAASDGTILGVLASVDGGAAWNAVASPDTSAGLRGFYNNCIAVSPQRPDVVVVGWQNGGPFVSEDGGRTWTPSSTNEHLHSDLHALFLARTPTGGAEPLFVGGDGGVVVTRDFGRSFHSQFNRPLNNLQFYGGGRQSLLGSYAGTLTASSRYPGLLAGGTQDNGNIYRCPDVRRDGVPRQADTFWLKQMGGDGDINRFVDPLAVLLNFNNSKVVGLGMAEWNETTNRFPDGPGAVVPVEGGGNGVFPTAVEVVPRPAFRREGRLMYAVVGSTADGLVHGLFSNEPTDKHPHGGNVTLVRLGVVGGVVTAIGSTDGVTLMVGTDNGRIVSLDSASGAVTEFALPDIADEGAVTRIEIFPSPVVLGDLPDNAFALVGDRIFRFNGLFWAATNGTDWVAFALDEPSNQLFAATDADVFVSSDRGITWRDASTGLPSRPHCTDLRIASDGRGGRDLYLATYGRSAWRATIAERPKVFDLPPKALEVLVGVLEDGGGLVRVGGRIIKLGPRPLTRDLLTALAAEDTARSMSEESETSSRAIRRAALQQISEIALREAERLR